MKIEMNPLKCHSEMDDTVTARARDMLRHMCKDGQYKSDDTSADAVVEQVWNVLVGLPTANE